VNPTDVADRLTVGGTAGLIAGLVFALFAVITGFQTKWIVQGWLYKEAEARSKSWQALVESQGDKMDRVLSLAESQQSQTNRLIERSERQERMNQDIAAKQDRYHQENTAKIDRLLVMLETQQPRRTTR
jgi:hypothetical protein